MLPSAPPTLAEANAPLRVGAKGWPVYALQEALTDAAGLSVKPDGLFGHATGNAVAKYQAHIGLRTDGVCGPVTKSSLSAAVCRRLDRDKLVPAGLPRGFARGEGGDNLSAVNWSVVGGVDCSLFQLRCYGPPYDRVRLGLAFSPYRAGLAAMGTLAATARRYAHPAKGCPFSGLALAVLAHNWQSAAQTYWRYGRLPNPGKDATLRTVNGKQIGWVPASLPASARTYSGWAHFYVASIMRGVE